MHARIALVICLGATGCAAPIGSLAPVSQRELCDELSAPVEALAVGLTAHPETADAVGEPGVEIIITTRAGCAQ